MEEETGGRNRGVWQPPALDLDGGETTPGGLTVPGRTPAEKEHEASGSGVGPGTPDPPLDIAPAAVVDSTAETPAGGAATMPPGLDGSRSQAGGTKKAGGGRRRTGVALLTAGGVIVLAAAPFAMVSPTEHIVGESASSTSKEHDKPAAKKPAPGSRTVAAPVPTWPTQSSPEQPGNPQPTPPVWDQPNPAESGTPAPSPTDPGFPAPSPSPSAPGEAASPAPSESPQPNRVRSKAGSGQEPRSSDSPTPKSSEDNQATRTVRTSPQPTKSATVAEHDAATKARSGSSASPKGQTRVIHGTYVLNPGQEVHTNRIRLTLQTDGNLVLQDEHGAVVWSTGTNASGTHAVFQADGNFVLYSSSQETLWSTRTDGHDGADLVMQANGDLAIVQGGTTLWKTNTAK